jgi:predicted ATPase
LDEALAVIHRNGERYYLAELYRIKGELLLLQATERGPAQAAAEECFHQSIKIARQQKAKSWELRAVMSLARLYQDQNKRAEAHSLLEQIYCNFTEGFDTADLREAKALLDELAGASADVRTS